MALVYYFRGKPAFSTGTPEKIGEKKYRQILCAKLKTHMIFFE
jgi:hypothetical protein